MSKPESYASVWDAIADTPEEAANLRARAELMQKIGARLKKHDWTQAEAANRCGVTQPRINDLPRGRVSRFSLDALVNIATALGCRVRVGRRAADLPTSRSLASTAKDHSAHLITQTFDFFRIGSAPEALGLRAHQAQGPGIDARRADRLNAHWLAEERPP